MTYNEICERFRLAGIESCKFDASAIVSRFCGIPAERLPFSRDTELTGDGLEHAVALRESRYPLQYILGEWGFCGETYRVGPGCLIPREETELIVLEADGLLPENGKLLDLCTGSGCIPVSLAARRPDATAVGVDISSDALKFASLNSELNRVPERVTFRRGDIFSDSLPRELEPLGAFDIITSNPPYIPSDEIERLAPELSFEPRSALDGGSDGLVFYRALIPRYRSCLSPNGAFIFEIGYDQGDALMAIAESNGFDCRVEKDLSGNDRMAVLTAPKSRNN